MTLTATAPGPGGSVIDLGECTATILPAATGTATSAGDRDGRAVRTVRA